MRSVWAARNPQQKPPPACPPFVKRPRWGSSRSHQESTPYHAGLSRGRPQEHTHKNAQQAARRRVRWSGRRYATRRFPRPPSGFNHSLSAPLTHAPLLAWTVCRICARAVLPTPSKVAYSKVTPSVLMEEGEEAPAEEAPAEEGSILTLLPAAGSLRRSRG